jgi:hypothetical protein
VRENEGTVTILANTNYMFGLLKPQVYWAWDISGNAHIIGPSLYYMINDNWDITVGANIFWGDASSAYANFGALEDFDEIYAKIKFSF